MPGRSGFCLCGDAAHVCDAPISPAQVMGEVVAVRRGSARPGLRDVLDNGWPRSARPPADDLMANDESTSSMKAITMGVLRSNRFSRLLAGWTVAILLCLCAVPQDAGAAVLQQVQSGTAVNSANGIQTVTISSIDITKSFLIFQVRSTGDRPVSTTLRGRLASSTTIQFERADQRGRAARDQHPVVRGDVRLGRDSSSAARQPCRR